MKYFIAFLLLFTTTLTFSQETQTSKKVTGTIVSNNTLLPLANVNIINVNKVKGTMTNAKGYFEIDVTQSDTLHITSIGFQSIKVRVTSDWIKNGNAKIQLTEKAIALEEVVVKRYQLTGYLEIDTKLTIQYLWITKCLRNWRSFTKRLLKGFKLHI